MVVGIIGNMVVMVVELVAAVAGWRWHDDNILIVVVVRLWWW